MPEHEQAFIAWLVETVHYPFDFSFSTPPPVDHDKLADHWNEWDGWKITPEEARTVVYEEAGMTRVLPPGTSAEASGQEGERD